MKVISSNEITYSIYKDNIKMYDNLPPAIYRPFFSRDTGWYLEKDDDLDLKEKIYSNIPKRADHIYKGCMRADRNMGIILSGRKGLGKSMCATYLCCKFINEAHLPVILIDSHLEGVAGFLKSITEPCVVVFDEYDKNYSKLEHGSLNSGDRSDRAESQEDHLSLFNGLGTKSKKIFIITCNYINALSDLFINRTGRFHYHIRFEYPNHSDIREYLEDLVNPKYHKEIDKVIQFSNVADLTFDSLRSIAFELNDGLDFEDFINDLNILPTEFKSYELKIQVKGVELDGGVLLRYNARGRVFTARVYNTMGDYLFSVVIPSEKIKFMNSVAKIEKPYDMYIRDIDNRNLKKKPIEITNMEVSFVDTSFSFDKHILG